MTINDFDYVVQIIIVRPILGNLIYHKSAGFPKVIKRAEMGYYKGQLYIRYNNKWTKCEITKMSSEYLETRKTMTINCYETLSDYIGLDKREMFGYILLEEGE